MKTEKEGHPLPVQETQEKEETKKKRESIPEGGGGLEAEILRLKNRGDEMEIRIKQEEKEIGRLEDQVRELFPAHRQQEIIRSTQDHLNSLHREQERLFQQAANLDLMRIRKGWVEWLRITPQESQKLSQTEESSTVGARFKEKLDLEDLWVMSGLGETMPRTGMLGEKVPEEGSSFSLEKEKGKEYSKRGVRRAIRREINEITQGLIDFVFKGSKKNKEREDILRNIEIALSNPQEEGSDLKPIHPQLAKLREIPEELVEPPQSDLRARAFKRTEQGEIMTSRKIVSERVLSRLRNIQSHLETMEKIGKSYRRIQEGKLKQGEDLKEVETLLLRNLNEARGLTSLEELFLAEQFRQEQAKKRGENWEELVTRSLTRGSDFWGEIRKGRIPKVKASPRDWPESIQKEFEDFKKGRSINEKEFRDFVLSQIRGFYEKLGERVEALSGLKVSTKLLESGERK